MGGRRGMNVWTVLVIYSSWHEIVSRKRLHVTCQCHVFSQFRSEAAGMIPNQAKVKMFSVHWSVYIFFVVWMRTGSGSLWLLRLSPVLRPETSSHEPGPGSVLGSRHFYLVYWGLFVKKGILQVIILFWCLLLLKLYSDSKTLFTEDYSKSFYIF